MMRLKSTMNSKWFNLSKSFYGKVDDDGKFNLKQSISFFSFMRVGQTVYLNGQLVKDENCTTIHIKISPNIFLSILIFLIPLLWLNILFGDNSFFGKSDTRFANFILTFIKGLVLYGVVQVSSYFLRRRFEKAMSTNGLPLTLQEI